MQIRVVVACAALIGGLCGPALAQPAGTARVAGTVLAADGVPIEAAIVTLVLTGDDAAVLGRWRAPAGADGVFLFEGLAGGRYQLSAERPGYTDVAIVPPAGTERGTRQIDVGDGGVADQVDLVLRRAGSIAGRILRPDGAPAAAADVMAALRVSSAESLSVVVRTTSEFDGRYELTGLPAGEYLVAVRPHPDAFFGHDEASRAAITAVTLYPSVPESGPGVPVRVFEATPTEGIDVWFLPAPQRFNVAGRVFDPDGRRLRDMAIEYSDLEGLRRGVWLVTDPDGYFAIEGIPPGTLLMLARANSDDGPLVGNAATTITVDRAEEVRLTMGPPGAVEGRVVAERGLTLPHDSIQISLVHTRIPVSILYPVATASPDVEGRFQLPRAFGTYRFEVSGLPEGWTVTRVLRAGREVEDGRIIVAHDEPVGSIELVVGP